MTQHANCDCHSTIEDLRQDISKLSDAIERIDSAIRGDGQQQPGLVARVNALEEDNKATKELKRMAVGAIVLGVLGVVGGWVMMGFKAFASGHN